MGFLAPSTSKIWHLSNKVCRGTLPRVLCPIHHHQVICRVDAGKAGTGGNGTPLFAALLPAATGSSPILQSLPSPASKKRKASNKQSTEVTAGTCPYQHPSQSNGQKQQLYKWIDGQVITKLPPISNYRGKGKYLKIPICLVLKGRNIFRSF